MTTLSSVFTLFRKINDGLLSIYDGSHLLVLLFKTIFIILIYYRNTSESENKRLRFVSNVLRLKIVYLTVVTCNDNFISTAHYTYLGLNV